MTSNTTVPWEWLEKRSAPLLILAGLVQLVAATLNVIPELTALSIPELMLDLTLASAGVLALLGLLGFVPRLRDEAPRLARTGSFVAIVGVIGELSVAIAEPLHGAEEPPVWALPIFIIYIVGVPLSFLVFGAASFRTGIPSRRIGGLVLLVFVSSLFFFHYIPLPIEGILVHVPSVVIGGALVITGYLVHAGSTVSGRAKSTSEPATR